MPEAPQLPKVKTDRGKNLTRDDRARGGRNSAAKGQRNARGWFVKRAAALALAAVLFWGIFEWLGLSGDHPVGATKTGAGGGQG